MWVALIWYWIRTTVRRSSAISWLVLGVALYVSLSLVMPPLQLPLRAIGVQFPALVQYEIAGTVRDSGSHDPVAAVQISVGGYATTTDRDGRYTLRFSASSPQDVSIVFTDRSTNKVRFVDMGSNNQLVLDETVR